MAQNQGKNETSSVIAQDGSGAAGSDPNQSAKEKQDLMQKQNIVDTSNTFSNTQGTQGTISELEEFRKTKSLFNLDLKPKMINLPSDIDFRHLNVKYPLIAPHAFAHLFWDEKNDELVYYVEEPILNEIEDEILRLLKLGMEEMINVSYISATKHNIVLLYLEQNVQSILNELGTKVSIDTYQKLMYYIYRDFIGINEIEPLMRDYFIEDIECNGVGAPVYIVHRKYRNLRTNVIYRQNDDLTSFVEKLAQKSGRYVSYAQPLLDGTLPDGSRINATYSSDVTTRGPTFTIRKFTKDPWTPTHLIKMGTASAEVFAYCWLAIENKFNVIAIGETGSGKTTFLNSIVSFIPSEARVCSIEDTRELNLAHENWLPAVTRAGFGVAGEKYGEVTLFDLLRETFRQNPDYVIVGEVRDKETYVLFQGMASGHSSFSTFHASSVDSLVRRLETPPISLPASLIESLNIICIMSHIKDQEKNIRRLKELNEVISVKQDLGEVDCNLLFEYDPVNDENMVKNASYIVNLIHKMTGIPVERLDSEIAFRTALLKKLVEKNIQDYKEFGAIINSYYKNPDAVLKRYGIDRKSASENNMLRPLKNFFRKDDETGNFTGSEKL
ncbi:MAG: type II/IV secretion system ATPase subunit [Candidatus Woesearchaeota archaeon]